jgi:uncharacterized protein (DUF1501 family)
MNAMDRRSFLKGIGGVVVATSTGSLVLDVLVPGLAPKVGADVLTDTLPLGTPILVNITMDGGNDYLNTLVPVDNPWYFDATYGHGSLALDPATTLALSGLPSYRLHPSLSYLAERWNGAGDVAFVLGVGEQTKKNFSHFDSMAYWQTADVTMTKRTGWMGRYTDRKRPGSPLATVSLGELRREAVPATAPALVVRDASQFVYQLPWVSPTVFRTGLDRMATMTATGSLKEAAKAISSTFAVTSRVSAAADPNVTSGGPHDALTARLLQAAQLIRAGIPAQTYTVGFGPFDSHDNQHAMQTARFGELNTGLTKFFGALAGHPRANDVFVMITSEFGRQATLNLTGGTDHGQAGLGIFIGSRVKRGLFGLAPTLDPGGPTRPNRIFDALKPTVDFRAMHATALSRLSDAATAQAVLGASYPNLGVF